ncbi:hypothetical protein C9374_014546 [Naegleria lovaniensis]|uniref:Protein kinase domain-containing protein n=1 Tax=Naegleria lovaniensis TaxID=51637 RepID=A0AA88GVG1_NAELO|nr:uncharacterized protein C9374_014546 [Naegleria lovaniensis]KAG2389146.1 hypothetical protein C9374_014546 [Naegleria lovaniensis]
MLEGNNNSKSTTSPPNTDTHNDHQIVRIETSEEASDEPVHHHQHNNNNETEETTTRCCVNQEEKATQTSSSSRSSPPSTTSSPQQSLLTIQVASSNKSVSETTTTTTTQSLHTTSNTHHHHNFSNHHHHHSSAIQQPSCSEISTSSSTIIDPYIPISSSKSHLYKPMIDVCLRNTALDLSKFTSPRFDYKIIKKLGGGIEGQVFLATLNDSSSINFNTSTPPQYAIKRITISTLPDLEQQIKLILQVCNVERESMAMMVMSSHNHHHHHQQHQQHSNHSLDSSSSHKFQHSSISSQVHIVPHYDIYYKEYKNSMRGECEYVLSIVMAFCDLGSLEDVIFNYATEYSKSSSPFISGELKLDWMINITRSLVFFHKRKLVHLDIKPDNILLQTKNSMLNQSPPPTYLQILEHANIYVSDFGLTREFRVGDSPLMSITGSKNYMAPEIFDGKYYNESVDMWALGIVALQLLVQKRRSRFDSLRNLLFNCSNNYETKLVIDNFISECVKEDESAIISQDGGESSVSVSLKEPPITNNTTASHVNSGSTSSNNINGGSNNNLVTCPSNNYSQQDQYKLLTLLLDKGHNILLRMVYQCLRLDSSERLNATECLAFLTKEKREHFSMNHFHALQSSMTGGGQKKEMVDLLSTLDSIQQQINDSIDVIHIGNTHASLPNHITSSAGNSSSLLMGGYELFSPQLYVDSTFSPRMFITTNSSFTHSFAGSSHGGFGSFSSSALSPSLHNFMINTNNNNNGGGNSTSHSSGTTSMISHATAHRFNNSHFIIFKLARHFWDQMFGPYISKISWNEFKDCYYFFTKSALHSRSEKVLKCLLCDVDNYVYIHTFTKCVQNCKHFPFRDVYFSNLYVYSNIFSNNDHFMNPSSNNSESSDDSEDDEDDPTTFILKGGLRKQQQQQQQTFNSGGGVASGGNSSTTMNSMLYELFKRVQDEDNLVFTLKGKFDYIRFLKEVKIELVSYVKANPNILNIRDRSTNRENGSSGHASSTNHATKIHSGAGAIPSTTNDYTGKGNSPLSGGGGGHSSTGTSTGSGTSSGGHSSNHMKTSQQYHSQHSQQQPTMSGGSPSASLSNIMMSSMKSPQQHHHHTLSKHNSSSPNRSFSSSSSSSTSSHHQYSQSMSSIFHGANSPYLSHAPLFSNVNVLSMDMNDDFYNQQMRTRKRAAVIGVRNTNFDILFQSGDYESNGNNKNGGTGTGSRPKNHTLSMASTNSNSNLNSSTMAAAAHASISSLTNRFSTNSVNSNVTNTTTDFFYNKYSTTPITYVLNCRNCNFTDVDLSFFVSSIQRYYMEHIYTVSDQHSTSSSNILQLLASHNVSTVQTGSVTKIPLLISMRNILNMNYMEDFTDKMIQGCFEYYFGTAIKTSNNTDSAINIVSPLVGDAPQVSMGSFSDPMSVSSSFIPGTPTSPRGFTIPSNKSSHMLHSTSTMNGFSSKSHLQFNKDIQQYLRQQILNGNCILIFDHFQHFKGQDYYNILSQLSAFTNNTIYIVENQSQPTMMDDMSHPLDPNFNTFYSHYILKNIDIHSCGVNNISSLLQNCTAVNHASGQNILLTSTTLSDLSLFNNTTPTNTTVNSSSVHSGAMNDASSSKKTNSLRGKNNLLPSQDLQNSKKKSFGGFLANTLFNEFNEFDFRYLEIARIPSFSYYFALKQSHEEYGGEIPIRMIIEQFLNKYYLSSDLSLMPLNTSHTISNNNNNSSSSSTTASLAIHRTSSGGSIGGGTSHSFGTTTWQHASTPDTAQRSSRDGSSDSLNPSSNMIPPYLAIDSTLSPQEGTNSDSTTTSKRTRSRSLRFSMGISNSNNTNNTNNNNTNNTNNNNTNTNNNSTMHTHHGLGGGKRDSKNFISNFFHPSQPPSHSGNNTSGLNSPSNQLRLSLKDHYDDRKRISFNNIEQFTKNEKLLTVNDLIEFILDLAEYLSISKIEKFRKLPEDFFDGKPQLYRLIWKQIMFIYQMYYEDDHQISSQQFPLLGYLPQFKYFIMPTVVREYLTGVQWAKKEKHSLIRYLKRKTLKTVFKPKLTIRTSVIRKFYLDPFYRKCIYNMVHFMDKDEVKALLNKLQKDKLVLSEQVIIERILIRNLSIDKLEQFSNQVRRSSGMDLSGRTRASINPSNPTMMAATSLGAVHGSSNSSSSNISNVLGNTTAGMRSSWFGGNYESAHQSSSFISGIHTNTTNTTSMSQSLGDSFYVEDYIKDIGLIENLYREYLKRAITSKYVAIQNIALRILTSSTNDLNANTFIDVLSDFLKRNEPSDQSEDSQPIIFTTMEKKKSIFNSRKPTTSFRLSQPSSSPSSFQQDNDFFSVQNFNISNVVHSSGCIERLIEYCQENYLFEQMTTLLMNIYGTTPYLLLIVLSSPTIDVVLNRQVLNVYMHLLKKCVSDLLILINLSSERTQGNSQSHHQRYATSIGGNLSMSSSSSSSTGNNHESGSSSTNHSFYGSMMNRSQQHQHQQTNTTTNGIADVSFFILFKLILVLIRRIQMISPDEFISPSLESKSSYDSYKIVYPLYNNLFKHYSNIAHRSSKITLKCVDFLLALLGNNIVLDSDMCEKVTDDFKQIINYNFNGKIVHSLEYNVKFYDHVTKFVEVFEQDESYMNKLISLFVPHSINNMQVKDPIYGIDSLIAQSLLNLNNEGGGFLKLISCMQKNKEIILLMIMERILLNHYQFLKNTYSSRSNQVHSPTSENETSMSEYYDLYYQGILKKDYISIKRNHIIPRFIQLSKSVLILLANIESESKHGEEPSSDEEGDNDDEDDEEEEEEDDNSPSSIKNHDSSTEIHTNQPHSPHTKSSPRTPKTRRIRKHEEGVDSCAHHDSSSSSTDDSSSSSTDDSHSSDEEDERDSSQTTTATPPPHMNRHNSNLLLMSQQKFLSLDTASDKIIHIIRVCIRSLLPNMLDGHSRYQNSSTALGGGVASIPSNIESYYFDSFNLEQHLSCLYIVSHLLPIYGNHTITCKGVPLIIERIFCDLLSILFKSLIRISQQQHPTEFKQSILLLIYRYYLKIIKIYMMNYRYYQRDKQLDASRQFGHYQNLHAHQQSMLNNLSMLLLLFIHDDNRNSYEINNNLITKTFKVLSLLPISSERVIKRFMDIIQNSSEPFIIRFYATFYLNEIFRKDQNLSNVNALTLYSNTETEKQLIEGISSFILNSNTEKLLNHIFHLIKYGTNQQQKEAFEQVISKRLIATTSQSFHVGSAHGKKTFTTSSNVGSDLWLGHLIYPNNSNHHGMNLSGHGMNTPTSHSPGMNTPPTGHSSSTNTTNHHHYGFHTTTGNNVRASTSFTSHTRNNSSNHSTPLSQQSSTSHNKRKSTGSVFISNMFGNISGASSLIEDSLNFGYSNMTTHIHYLPPQIMMSLNGTQSSCMEHSIVRLGLETISSRFNVLNDITALQNQWNMTFSNLSSTSSLIQSTTNHSNGTISSLSFNSVAAEEIVKGMRTFVDLMQHEHLKPFIIEQLFDIIRQCRELLICIKMDDEMIRKLKMYCPVEYFFMAHELYHV